MLLKIPTFSKMLKFQWDQVLPLGFRLRLFRICNSSHSSMLGSYSWYLQDHKKLLKMHFFRNFYQFLRWKCFSLCFLTSFQYDSIVKTFPYSSIIHSLFSPYSSIIHSLFSPYSFIIHLIFIHYSFITAEYRSMSCAYYFHAWFLLW